MEQWWHGDLAEENRINSEKELAPASLYVQKSHMKSPRVKSNAPE
jgi:hypothetical protein